jgi:hypothetical protein
VKVLLSAILLFAAALPAGAAIRPASRPTDPLLIKAHDAAKNKSLGSLAAEIDPKLRAELERESPNLAEVLRLASLREFGRYFSRISEFSDGGIDTLAWLAEEPDLLPALMMGIAVTDPPDRVLEVLRGLRADHRTTIAEFPELAAAVCVVWDAPERFGPEEDVAVDPAEPSRVFDHFRKSADRLALDPRRLPIDLLIYVVDLHLTQQEIDWATRYGPRPSVAGTFLAVPYREGVNYDRNTRELTDQAYLLPNVLRRGGSVTDAAYFATEIAKANGIPAAVCASDITKPTAAWAAFMQFGSRPTWDFNSARHKEHGGWIGEAIDPQTGDTRTEPELALTVGALATPARERMTSAAVLKSIDLVPREKWIDTYRRAIELSPANLAAWLALADFVAKEKLDDDAIKPIEQLMQKHLARRWPALPTVLRLRMLNGRGTIEFEHGVDRAADAVRDHPELVAMVRLAAVDRMREDKRFREAETALMTLMQRQGTLSPAVAQAVMTRLDELLRRGDGELERLSAIYKEVFEALPRPNPSRHARSTPYYQLGWKYAQVLEEMKDSQRASALRTKLENLVLPPTTP